MSNLTLAFFDPEFYKTYEKEITEAMSAQSGITFQQATKSNLNRVLSFLKA